MLIAGIVVLGVIILGVLVILLCKYMTADKYLSIREEQNTQPLIYISKKGVNLDSGSLGGGSGELFRGNGNDKLDTISLSRDLSEGRYTFCIRSMGTGKVFQGNFSREFIIGRGGSGQQLGMMLPFPSVSRTHCRVFLRGKQMYVEDMGSSFGTYVNGIEAKYQLPLRKGDILELGKERFEVE